MKVLSKKTITLDKPVPVYDITVPETENFQLASGITVHNSKDLADAVVGAFFNCFAYYLPEIDNEVKSLRIKAKRMGVNYSEEAIREFIINNRKDLAHINV
jgi:hypothetical protein